MNTWKSTAFLLLGLCACAGPATDDSDAAHRADDAVATAGGDQQGEDASAAGTTASSASGGALVDEFGPPPARPERAVRAWFASYLTHPELAEFELADPEQGYYGTAQACRTGEGVQFAWLVTTQVRETDPQRGASTVRTFHCWFRSNDLLAVFEPARLDPEYGVSASLRQE